MTGAPNENNGNLKPASAGSPIVPKIQYVERPEIQEVFADSIESISVDGPTVRLNFCVTRMSPGQGSEQPTGKRYPACRLVLSMQAGLELMAQLKRIEAALLQAGVLKSGKPPSRQETEPTSQG